MWRMNLNIQNKKLTKSMKGSAMGVARFFSGVFVKILSI